MVREFEKGASEVLEQVAQRDQNASHELLDPKFKTWDKKHALFTLAERVGPGVFVNSNCCQAKLDKTWIGETTLSTSFFAVSNNV